MDEMMERFRQGISRHIYGEGDWHEVRNVGPWSPWPGDVHDGQGGTAGPSLVDLATMDIGAFGIPIPPEPEINDHDLLQEFLYERCIDHFSAWEICPRRVPHRTIWPDIIPTLRYAEILRRQFGICTVHSGYRDPFHNAEVGGAPRSLHLDFNALDITFRDGTPREWASEAKFLGLDDWGGVGLYPTFIHIDTRYLVFGRRPWEG